MSSASAETKKYWRKQIKKRAIEAFGNKCHICGQSFPDSVYDFHHINSTLKDFSFGSSLVSSKSRWYDIRDELLKCIMVCSNCHRIIHNEEHNIVIEEKNYFNMDFYEWDVVDYIINQTTGEKICKNKKEMKSCSSCGVLRERLSPAGLCKVCYDISQRVVKRPNREKLKELIRNNSFLSLAKQYGVSDNAIRKWCKIYDLPFQKRKIDSFTNEEWSNI